ncbi:MAG: peptidylprolyl isomerase [Oscillospiraceae bacterium]|nr:peptidylprolyl isomerase [Oscillospiraceae bacterium]
MSASREKQRRKQQAAQGGAENKRARADISAVLFRNLLAVLCVVLVLALVAVILVGQGVPQQYITAVTAEGQSITAAEFNFFYYASLNDFYNEMGSFLVSYGMLDPAVPLNRQDSWTEGQTWHDYIVEATVSKIHSTVVWSEYAKREGVSMNEEDLAFVEDMLRSARESAAAQGVSVNKLLSTSYGRGVNENNFRRFVERQVLASRYEAHLYESFTFSEQEITEHYNANKELFDKVDYREFRVSQYVGEAEYARLMEENDGEEIDLNELVDSPVGEITFEAKLAYDKVAALAENPELTEESFNELAAALADEESRQAFEEDPDHTLIKGASFSGDGHDHDDTGHDPGDNLSDWLFDAARSRGDVTVMADDADYVAVMFLERIVEDDQTVNMRQIVFIPSSDNDAGWNDAERRANALLETFGGGEQEFIALVRDNTADVNTRHTGGLYKEMRRAGFENDEAFAQWLFDPAREPGDCEVLRSSSGYHIIYFSSWGRPFWQVNVESTLRNHENNELREEKAANLPAPGTNWLGMRLITRA